MPRNTLGDLNNQLFEQLERLNDESIKGDDLREEIARAKAVASIASQIIANGTLVIKAEEFKQEYILDPKHKKLPPMLRAEFLGELED